MRLVLQSTAIVVLLSLVSFMDLPAQNHAFPVPQTRTDIDCVFLADSNVELADDLSIECASTEIPSEYHQVCAKDSRALDLTSFREIRDLLAAHDAEVHTLCALTLAFLDAIDACDCHNPVELETLAELSIGLAANWLRVGNARVGRKTYLLAYRLLDEAGYRGLSVVRVLRGLAELEAYDNRRSCAAILAGAQSYVARELYSGEYISLGLLVDSLRFEGRALYKLGWEAEASIRLAEADELARQLDQCDGPCPEAIQRLDR